MCMRWLEALCGMPCLFRFPGGARVACDTCSVLFMSKIGCASQDTTALAEPAASVLGRRVAGLEAALAVATSDAAGAAAAAAGAVQRVATAEWRIEEARRGLWPARMVLYLCSRQCCSMCRRVHLQHTWTGQL